MQTAKLKVNNKIKKKEKAKESLLWYIMIIVPLVGFFVFTLYPLVWAIVKAWFFYDGTISSQRYIGMDNFLKLFTTDKTYWNSWLVTLKFAVFKIPIELTIAMCLALMLNQKIRMSSFFRSVFYLPNILSVAVIGVIFTNMFGYFGYINAVLTELGIIEAEIDWFANAGTAMATLVIASIWNTYGVNVMYFLAALQNVPAEMYEAAYIDGAKKPTIFFRITVPMMGPVLQTVLLLSINGTLHINDLILVMTNGAPGGKTYSVSSYVVSNFVPGFVSNTVNIGYGCSMAIVTSVIMMVIAFVYNRSTANLSNTY